MLRSKLAFSVIQSLGIAALLAASSIARADDPEAWIEIFKLAPGKQEAFLRSIALADEVAKAGGQPPTLVYLHQDGGDWDVLLLKPVLDVKPTSAQQAAMAAKSKELGIPTGPAYWIFIRELMASHTDTQAVGPIVAAEWLAKLEAQRAAQKSAVKP
jgi:hypothetical protein